MKKSELGNECGVCHTKENIVQFLRATKRGGLPIVESSFICVGCAKKEGLIKICVGCAKKEGLIKDSTEVVPNPSQS